MNEADSEEDRGTGRNQGRGSEVDRNKGNDNPLEPKSGLARRGFNLSMVTSSDRCT